MTSAAQLYQIFVTIKLTKNELLFVTFTDLTADTEIKGYFKLFDDC